MVVSDCGDRSVQSPGGGLEHEASHADQRVVTDALRMAWFRRRPGPGLIFHSDRGSQYCSHDFQGALKGYEMRPSMSRKGDCWDNAPTESLWGRLKVGRLYGKRFATRREAMDEVQGEFVQRRMVSLINDL